MSADVIAATRTTGRVQTFRGHTAQVSSVNGKRYAFIDGSVNGVPVDILPMMAGKDVWMRKIKVTCSICGRYDEAAAMEGGGTDLCCSACFEEAGEENEAQDMGEKPRTHNINQFTKSAVPVRGRVCYVSEASDLGWKPEDTPQQGFKLRGLGSGDEVVDFYLVASTNGREFVYGPTHKFSKHEKIRLKVLND